MTDYEEILSRLSPEMQKKVRRASEIKSEKLALTSIGINKALGGGIRYGSQTMLWGNRSGGKTGLALGAIKNAQQEGKSCAIIEPEKSIDDPWLLRNGIDSDNVIQSSVGSIEDCADLTIDMMRAGLDVVVIDSISALLPNSYFDEGELKGLGGTNQIGQFSRDIGRMTAMFNYSNVNTAVILISQIRTNLGGYHASLQPMGGKAVDHYNTTSLKLWASNSDADTIKADVHVGDRIFNKPVGREVTWTLDKARGPGMGMTGKYNFYFDGEFVGVDTVGEIVSIATNMNIIKKAGKWYDVFGKNCNGEKAAVKYVREDREIYAKLVSEVM